MRVISKAVLAGTAAAALAGAALAADDKAHVMHVALPDGSVAQVRYEGEVAPKVTVVPSRIDFVPVTEAAPMMAIDPFAMFDQVFAEMNARTDAMLRQAAALAAQAPAMQGQVSEAALRELPAGTVSYSFVSTSSGAGTCSRSIQVTSLGAGQAPKVEQQSSGDCTAMTRPVTPAVQPEVAPTRVRVTPVKLDKPAETVKPRQTI